MARRQRLESGLDQIVDRLAPTIGALAAESAAPTAGGPSTKIPPSLRLAEADGSLLAAATPVSWSPSSYRTTYVPSLLTCAMTPPNHVPSPWKFAMIGWPCRKPVPSCCRNMAHEPMPNIGKR